MPKTSTRDGITDIGDAIHNTSTYTPSLFYHSTLTIPMTLYTASPSHHYTSHQRHYNEQVTTMFILLSPRPPPHPMGTRFTRQTHLQAIHTPVFNLEPCSTFRESSLVSRAGLAYVTVIQGR